jgi:folate-binding protein YgfZ
MGSILGYEYESVAHLLVTDEDAADFLQSQFSNELRPFNAGRCSYGLWLDVKGKVIGDSVILCEGAERFRVLSEATCASVIQQKLEQHIIADDVEIEILQPVQAIAIIGVDAASMLQQMGYSVPEAGTYVTCDDVVIYGGRRSNESSYELLSESAPVIATVKARLIELGVTFVSMQQVELIRMDAGIPSVPIEIGPGDLPGEGGFVGRGVSLSKGCYLGQEVVARMHNIGRPQRALFRLKGNGEAPQCPIGLYSDGSKQIGELRSVISTEAGWLGVALLKSRYAVVGESLNFDGGSAQITGLFEATQGGDK